MAETSLIEWTDATWNPITGCSVVSPGCANCYAMKLAGTRLQHHPSRAGLTQPSKAGPVWTGEVRFNEAWINQPFSWSGKRVFVCAHGDLFHEDVPDAWIDRVFAVMALTPRNTYQVLTKRAARMRQYIEAASWPRIVENCRGDHMASILRRSVADMEQIFGLHPRFSHQPDLSAWPIPNVWLGVSAEDQVRLVERVHHLLQTSASVRFLSAEPMLRPLDLTDLEIDGDSMMDALQAYSDEDARRDWGVPGARGHANLDWVIAGGESGRDARPMHPDWVRQIRDDCAAAGVPFFFKQWGEWVPGEIAPAPPTRTEQIATWFDDRWTFEALTPGASAELHVDDEPTVYRFGKKAAGRLLDGVEHNGMPA